MPGLPLTSAPGRSTLGKQYYQYSGGDQTLTVAASVTGYIGPGYKTPNGWGTEAAKQCRVVATCTSRRLWAAIRTNGITATSTFRTRKNGANGGQSLSVTSGATGEFEDTSGSDSLVDTDLFCLSMATGGSGTSMIIENLSVMVESAGAHVWTCSSTGSSGTIYILPANGGAGGVSSEGNTQYWYPGCLPDMTVSKLHANVTANTSTGTSTLRFRKNSANGNQAASIAAVTTGWVVDTSNTDTVTANDLINLAGVSGGGGMPTWGNAGYFTDGPTTYRASRGSGSTKRWGQLGSDVFSATETDADQSRAFWVGMSWGGLHVAVSPNTRNATTSVSLRRSGSSVITVSIAASTAGDYRDTSTVVQPTAASDDFYFEADFAPGSSGAVNLVYAFVSAFPMPYAKMAASAAMPTASVVVSSLASGAQMAATAAHPTAAVSESSPNINAAGALMAATASLKDLAGYARVDLGAVMAATAAGKDPVVALVETGFQQMAATATMPSATETEGQFIAAEQMAATAGEPSAAVSADVTMATLAATAQLDAMNPSQGVAMQAMAATADVVEMTIAEQLTLAKMAASAALKDALAAQGLAAQLWTAAASFPDAAVSLNLPVALWAATAQMSNPTVAQSAFAALMSATASLLTVAVPDGLIYRPRVRLGGGAGVVTKTPSGVVVRQKNSAGVVVRSGKLSGGIVS